MVTPLRGSSNIFKKEERSRKIKEQGRSRKKEEGRINRPGRRQWRWG
jgi:hypothetical protein